MMRLAAMALVVGEATATADSSLGPKKVPLPPWSHPFVTFLKGLTPASRWKRRPLLLSPLSPQLMTAESDGGALLAAR